MSTRDVRRLVARTLMPGFAGPVLPDWVRAGAGSGLRAVCLFGSNIDATDQLGGLCAELRALVPAGLVLAIDEEGGDVTRLHYRTGSPLPGAAALGRLDDTDLTAACATAVGGELAALGINLNLAPVADVGSNPANPVIGTRSFGATADLVGPHVAAWVTGQQGAGVAACVKHFPGHGDTVADSHLSLPVVEASLDTLRVRELPPCEAAFRAGAAAVMTSHIVVPAIDPASPATFSSSILRGVLRERLGFGGVVVSDALDMAGASAHTGIPEAAVRALGAGCDLLCLGSETTEQGYAAVLDAVEHAVAVGRLSVARLEDAAGRIDRLAAAYPAVGRGGSAAHPALALREVLDLGPRVEAWSSAPGEWVLVQVDTEANAAVGIVPWGLRAVTAAIDEREVRPGERVVVAARGIQPGHPALDVVGRLRAAGHAVLLVEHGWPRPGVDPDVVSFGGSPVLADTVMAVLDPGRQR